MAYGVTLKMRDLTRMMNYRTPQAWEPKDRDRSLPGKARIKQRKAKNKSQ